MFCPSRVLSLNRGKKIDRSQDQWPSIWRRLFAAQSSIAELALPRREIFDERHCGSERFCTVCLSREVLACSYRYEIWPERVMSQADDFRHHAARPIESNKTDYRRQAPRTADGKADAFQGSSTTIGPPARAPQDRMISQLNCCDLGTIYLNMFCRIDYLPCASAPV